jgi:hypothetical protein
MSRKSKVSAGFRLMMVPRGGIEPPTRGFSVRFRHPKTLGKLRISPEHVADLGILCREYQPTRASSSAARRSCSSCSGGITCEYKLNVTTGLECPMRSDTRLMLSPRSKRQLA